MTDATLPQLPTSLMATEARSTHSSSSNSRENDAYPFIVHSQQAITNGEPPEVDNSKLVRKNRKRTRYDANNSKHSMKFHNSFNASCVPMKPNLILKFDVLT